MKATNAMCFRWYSVASWYESNCILQIFEYFFLKKSLKYQAIQNSKVQSVYAYEKSEDNALHWIQAVVM